MKEIFWILNKMGKALLLIKIKTLLEDNGETGKKMDMVLLNIITVPSMKVNL